MLFNYLCEKILDKAELDPEKDYITYLTKVSYGLKSFWEFALLALEYCPLAFLLFVVGTFFIFYLLVFELKHGDYLLDRRSRYMSLEEWEKVKEKEKEKSKI